MMNSNHHFAETILDALFDLLSPEQVRIKIEEPIDGAVESFKMENTPNSQLQFNRIIAAFVRHVFRYGFRLPRHLSNRQALAEAILFLDTGYQNEDVRGYECALMDALDETASGIGLVLYQLAESIKRYEQGKYVNWVFTDYFSILDWTARECIVSIYLERYAEILPPELLAFDPARLVNEFHHMLTDHISTENTINQVLIGGMHQR